MQDGQENQLAHGPPSTPVSDLFAAQFLEMAMGALYAQLIRAGELRGPAAILFISRDTCSDSIAKLFRACFYGVSHNYRAILCKMGYRTDVPV